MDDFAWPCPLTERQFEQLEQYRQQLLTWNERMNLTSITDKEQVYVKHFYDSLAVLSIPWWSTAAKRGGQVIDIGTGAGFPGLPLAIVEQEMNFVLCDSLQKRVTFLEAVVQELGLKNVRCVHARSEDLARDPEYRGRFDVVVSRAVARLNILMELMCPFLRLHGVGFSYKGPGFDDERADGTRAAKKLHAKIQAVDTYTLPLRMGARTIVAFEQMSPLPDAYPRKAGIPQRKPL